MDQDDIAEALVLIQSTERPANVQPMKADKPPRLRQVFIESGPPGFSGKVGWLNENDNKIFIGPESEPVGPMTSFETFTDKFRCNTRPLNRNEKTSEFSRDSRGGSKATPDAFRS